MGDKKPPELIKCGECGADLPLDHFLKWIHKNCIPKSEVEKLIGKYENLKKILIALKSLVEAESCDVFIDDLKKLREGK